MNNSNNEPSIPIVASYYYCLFHILKLCLEPNPIVHSFRLFLDFVACFFFVGSVVDTNGSWTVLLREVSTETITAWYISTYFVLSAPAEHRRARDFGAGQLVVDNFN